MSQIMLPPPDQPQPQQPPQTPLHYPMPYDAPPPPYGAPMVTATPPTWQPDPPKQQALIWRIIKWPIRQALKGIYLAGRTMGSHKVVSAILIGLIVLFVGSGVFVYQQFVAPPIASTGGPQTGATSNVPDTPFTIENASAPPLPNGVIHFLHAFKVYDGQEEWDSLSPSLQQSLTSQGGSASSFQSQMDQQRASGLSFVEYIYTGGFIEPNGLATYTVQVEIATTDGQYGILNWYFYVDASSGLLVGFADMTPGASSSGS